MDQISPADAAHLNDRLDTIEADIAALRASLNESRDREPSNRFAIQLASRIAGRAAMIQEVTIIAARRADTSWATIGGELGITRQAAQQRFGHTEAAEA